MRFVTYQPKPSSAPRVGLRFSDSRSEAQVNEPGLGLLIDLEEGLKIAESAVKLGATLPKNPSMLDVITAYEEIREGCQWISKAFAEKKFPRERLVPESTVTLLSPIPCPPSMRDGYAFRQHVEAARRNRGVPMIPEYDHFPIFYYTNHLQVTGPGPVEVLPMALEQLDFELEVAVVIGKKGRNIPAERADEHIFGYMVMNDWSARKLQMDEMKLNLGPAKGKDFATSLGPYLVTREALQPYAVKTPKGEKFNLKMRAWLNDKEVSSGNLADMSFTFAQIIERASYGVTLNPGEVIGSGTVGTGCFLELNGSKITDNLWIKPGDTMKLEVDQLGILSNSVVKGSEAYVSG